MKYPIADQAIALDSTFYPAAVARILSHSPELVGFSTMCNSFHITLRLAECLRNAAPHITIVMGGPQVSFVDRETLETFEFVDFVLRGEAERSFPRLLDALAGGGFAEIAGLSWRDRGAVVQNEPPPPIEDLDELPYPAWHLFSYGARGAFSIDVGRGCPFSCKFCSTSVYFQRRFRLKSFQRIVDEIKWLHGQYGATAFTFVHDLFTANKKWVRAFAEFLIAHRPVDVQWSASARIDTVDDELLRKMAQSGCRALFYGIESGSTRIQQECGKRLKLANVEPIARSSAAAGIAPTLSFIAGFPTETVDDLADTFKLIGKLLPCPQANVQLHLMSPQSGTPDIRDHADRLRIDGYYSDIASGSKVFLTPQWFAEYPNLFPSFYYYDNPAVPRDLIKGADLFVRIPCSNMRYTIQTLSAAGIDLWELYRDWKVWLGKRGASADRRQASQYDSALVAGGDGLPARATPLSDPEDPPDELLLQFSDFIEQAFGERVPPDQADVMRDEVLAFYLRYYNDLNVLVHTGDSEPMPATTH